MAKGTFRDAASIRANAVMAHRIKDYISGKNTAAIRRDLTLWMANLIDLGGEAPTAFSSGLSTFFVF